MTPTIAEVESHAERIEVHTDSGSQVWHAWNRHAGKPLVLLHGGSGSWNHWARNALPLSQTRAVWAVDLPGMGDSTLPPGALDADDLHGPLEQGLQQLFAQTAIDLVGFSFGGLVLGYLAATHAARVKRMVLVGIPGLGLSNQITSMRGFREGMTPAERDAVHRNNLHAIMLADEALITPAMLAMQEHNVQRDRMRRRRIARSDAMLQLMPEWRSEVHGIWGEHDALYQGSLDRIQGFLSACDLRGFHVVPDAGHWVQYEQAERFNQVLLHCLQD
jgi:pimeloyl-ACP methyl ester carboxylesterase